MQLKDFVLLPYEKYVIGSIPFKINYMVSNQLCMSEDQAITTLRTTCSSFPTALNLTGLTYNQEDSARFDKLLHLLKELDVTPISPVTIIYTNASTRKRIEDALS